MSLTLLHTADVHVATFDTLRDRIAPGTALRHEVRPAWLDEARAGGVTPALAARVAALIASAPGPVLCTCTTLGPAAERHGATRIDRPAMEAAARHPGPHLLAFTLDSTRAASLALLAEQPGAEPRLLDLTAHWPLFEAGDAGGFHAAIASSIRRDLSRTAAGAVILAQASMAGAATLLANLPCPVLATPELALRAMLAR